MDEQQAHELGELVFAMRCFIAELEEKERVALFDRLASGYCIHCGTEINDKGRCCMKDGSPFHN